MVPNGMYKYNILFGCMTVHLTTVRRRMRAVTMFSLVVCQAGLLQFEHHLSNHAHLASCSMCICVRHALEGGHTSDGYHIVACEFQNFTCTRELL